MTTTSTTIQTAKHKTPRLPTISLRATGALVLLLLFLLTSTGYLLQATINYPSILLDKPTLASMLVGPTKIAVWLCFFGQLLCGVILSRLSLNLAHSVEKEKRLQVALTGGIAGGSLTIGALLEFTLLLFWGSTFQVVAQILAISAFVLTEIAVPLLLVVWTITLAWQFRIHKIVATIGSLGLCLIFLRSAFWLLNALLPVEAGFYVIAGILSIIGLIGESFWLIWLFLLSVRLLGGHLINLDGLQEKTSSQTQPIQRRRRALLKAGVWLGGSVVGGAFLVARTGLMMGSNPFVSSNEAPTETSFMGTLVYLFIFIFEGVFNPQSTVKQIKDAPQSKQPLPTNTTLENINAMGVPVQRISAAGASKSRVILYIHGGGFVAAMNDAHRLFAASLSQATGACVLLPEYRLAPEYPFPAGLQDCVTTYNWLLNQGIAPENIVLAGESAGANLVFTTTLSLRESGIPLPAALLSFSAPTDLAMTGETFKTKAAVDPILGRGLPKSAYAAYTNNGLIDVRNPLVSPYYADVHGLPPTLLQAGTQEVLLSDSLRMAERLRAVGVEVTLNIGVGMWHAWTLASAEIPLPVPEVSIAQQQAVDFIQRYLKR